MSLPQGLKEWVQALLAVFFGLGTVYWLIQLFHTQCVK